MTHSVPPRPSLRNGVVACFGIFIAISVLAFCSFKLEILLALGSFGSTSVLLFAFSESHFSQPRSIIGGHFISTAVGLLALYAFGPTWWALGMAVAVAVAVMMLTRTVHPPAGSNPIIVFLSLPHWHFLFFPTLFGAIALVSVGIAYHRSCGRQYPLYWLGNGERKIARHSYFSKLFANLRTSGKTKKDKGLIDEDRVPDQVDA